MRALYLYLNPDEFCCSSSLRAYRTEQAESVIWDRIVSTVPWAPRPGLRLWVRVEEAENWTWSATFQHVSTPLVAGRDGWMSAGPWNAETKGFFVLRMMAARIRVHEDSVEAPRLLAVVLTDDLSWAPSGKVSSQADLMGNVYGPVTGGTAIQPAVVVAGRETMLTVTYTCGVEGIRAQGGVRLGITSWPWDAPQNDDPEGYGYVKAWGPEGEALSIRQITRPEVPSAGREHTVEIGIDRPLNGGDTVTLEYGRREDGRPGARVPIVPVQYHRSTKDAWYQDLVPLSVSVDPDASGVFRPVSPERHHTLTVKPGSPDRIHLIAPSRVQAGEPFTVTAVVTDGHNNVPTEPWEGQLRTEDPITHQDKMWSFRKGEPPVMEVGPWVMDREGFYTIKAGVDAEGWEAESNPIQVVQSPADKVLWGDIHVHTHLSDGRGTAQRCFEYARDVARLDFVSVSDHDLYMSDGQWAYLQSLTAHYYDPGKFVTFVGCESGPQRSSDDERQIQGHRNLYTCEDQLPLYRHWEVAEHWDLDRLEMLLEMNPGMVAIPHHSLTLPMEWRSWKSTPAIEMYSVWGSSEKRDNPLHPFRQRASAMSVQDILSEGDHVGFLGGGDSHDGRPGLGGDHARIKSIWGNLIYKTGLTGVLAPDRTREAVWNAIVKRRTYATTGERMILDWEIDGVPMGGVVPLTGPTQPRHIKGWARGTRPISQVVIWKNGEIFWQGEYRDLGVEFSVCDEGSDEPAYYYVWVKQEGDGQAWASPIWVERTRDVAPHEQSIEEVREVDLCVERQG